MLSARARRSCTCGTTSSEAAELAAVEYRVVRLGRKRDRWLMNDEIGAAVVEALDCGPADFIVGEP